jgi:hypothetical protein
MVLRQALQEVLVVERLEMMVDQPRPVLELLIKASLVAQVLALPTELVVAVALEVLVLLVFQTPAATVAAVFLLLLQDHQ